MANRDYSQCFIGHDDSFINECCSRLDSDYYQKQERNYKLQIEALRKERARRIAEIDTMFDSLN